MSFNYVISHLVRDLEYNIQQADIYEYHNGPDSDAHKMYKGRADQLKIALTVLAEHYNSNIEVVDGPNQGTILQFKVSEAPDVIRLYDPKNPSDKYEYRKVAYFESITGVTLFKYSNKI